VKLARSPHASRTWVNRSSTTAVGSPPATREGLRLEPVVPAPTPRSARCSQPEANPAAPPLAPTRIAASYRSRSLTTFSRSFTQSVQIATSPDERVRRALSSVCRRSCNARGVPGRRRQEDPKRRFRLVRRCEDFLGEVDAAFVDEETPGPPTSGRVLRCGRPQNEQRRASPSSLRLRHGWRARPGSPRLAASTNTFLPPVPTTRIRSTSSRTHTSDQPFRSTSQPK